MKITDSELQIWTGVYQSFEEANVDDAAFAGSDYVEKRIRLLDEALDADRFRVGWTSGAAAAMDDLLTPILAMRADQQGGVRVLDFGGGVGLSYLKARRALPPEAALNFKIVENARICEASASRFRHDPNIDFVTELGEPEPFDVLNLGSSLHYLEDPRFLFEHARRCDVQTICIADFPCGEIETFITRQSYYEKFIPVKFWNFGEFSEMAQDYGFRVSLFQPFRGPYLKSGQRISMDNFEESRRLNCFTQILLSKDVTARAAGAVRAPSLKPTVAPARSAPSAFAADDRKSVLVFVARLVGLRAFEGALRAFPNDRYEVFVQDPEAELVCERLDQFGIPHRLLGEESDEELMAMLGGREFDWLLNLWGGRILRAPLLARCQHTLNLHPSLLPIGRGRDPVVWALKSGDPAGVTLHAIDAGVDTGPIWAQEEVCYQPHETGGAVYARVVDRAWRFFGEKWPEVRSGAAVLRPQDQQAFPTRRRAELDAARSVDADTAPNVLEAVRTLLATDFGRGFCGRLKLAGVHHRARLLLEPEPLRKTDAEKATD